MTAFAFNLLKINGNLLTGISSPNLDHRKTTRPLAHDATLHQTGAAVIRTAPMVRASTIAVRAMFLLFGTGDEVPFLALDGTNGVELIGAKIATAAPGYLATSTHASRKIAAGDAYLSRISWNPGDVARSEFDIYGISADGTTDPVAASVVALPTLPLNTEQTVLSSLLLGDLTLTRVASLDIQISHQGENNDEETCYSLGKPFPMLCKRAGVGGAIEVIATIETLDLTSTWTQGALVAVFTQVNNRGVGLDTETATVTINTPLILEDTIVGQDGGPAKRRITVRGLYDGTNKPITLTTG